MSILLYIVTDPSDPQTFKDRLFEASNGGEKLRVCADIATKRSTSENRVPDRLFQFWISNINTDPDDFFVRAQDEITNEWTLITVTQDKVMITVVR